MSIGTDRTEKEYRQYDKGANKANDPQSHRNSTSAIAGRSVRRKTLALPSTILISERPLSR
jgi:hypothetical protein